MSIMRAFVQIAECIFLTEQQIIVVIAVRRLIGVIAVATKYREQKEYRRLKAAEQNGLNLSPNALALICRAHNNNPSEIGKHLIGVLAEMRAKHPEQFEEYNEVQND